MTLRIGFDPTQCACAHDMSNRLIEGLEFSSVDLEGVGSWTADGFCEGCGYAWSKSGKAELLN